ncbi:MAG: glycosyltransferase family protein [Bacteroidota bacterium]|nr:glycosyltransferase family protein [Candidatus Kapabacteria bacterium]MDW8220125.1 glycosyltransferase family protein [Bacteroidota bacterium]
MTRIIAIVQARMSSTRLPGKVLKPLGSKPAIAQVIHQLSGANNIHKIVVATSVDASDDPVVMWARRAHVEYTRGSLYDVLDRYYHAALHYKPDAIVRITADCPLLDAEVVDAVIERFLQGDCDYAANINPPTYPDGLDTEVMTFAALERTWKEATHPVEREHVTLYIRNHPKLFRIANVQHTEDLSKLRWTLDTPEDYAFLNKVVQKLEMLHIRETKPRFSMHEVLALLASDSTLRETQNNRPSSPEPYFSSLQHDYVARL